MPNALVLGGATGLLGQALSSALKTRGWTVTTLGRGDADLLDQETIDKALDMHAPDAVFNAVAWTQVDDAEDHEAEAMVINRGLPARWAKALAARSQGRLIQFSTDFVFAGHASAPISEDAEPEPRSAYGRTKLEGEKAVQEILPDRSAILRTAWLFGPGRKNFVSTIIRASKTNDVLKVVDDQFGSPTSTTDLAEWASALAEAQATGIWHCVNSGRASWCELATEALHIASPNCRVQPITSAEWPQKAARPPYSVLDNSKLADFLGARPRPWPQALRDYLYGDSLP